MSNPITELIVLLSTSIEDMPLLINNIKSSVIRKIYVKKINGEDISVYLSNKILLQSILEEAISTGEIINCAFKEHEDNPNNISIYYMLPYTVNYITTTINILDYK